MNEFQQALAKWAKAEEIAEENPRLIIEANKKGAAECIRIQKICGDRMHALHDAEEELWKYKDSIDATPAMKAFVAAEEDRGCSRCWLSSKTPKDHPECQKKITRWFEARDTLIEEGLRLVETN